MLKAMCNHRHSDLPGRMAILVAGDIIRAALVPLEINERLAIN